MSEQIAGTNPRFNLVDFATGRLTKAADTAIERYAMKKDGKSIIVSTQEGQVPPEKRVADFTVSKERNNTSNINNSDPMKPVKDNIVPIAIGGGLAFIGLIMLITGKRGK